MGKLTSATVITLSALLGLAACSSKEAKAPPRVAEVTTTVDTTQGGGAAADDELTNTISAELEGWDERVDELKSRALQTRNADRFKMLNDNIGDMEKAMSDARKDFLDLRTAETDGSRTKYKDKINDDLKTLRQTYNKLPAE